MMTSYSTSAFEPDGYDEDHEHSSSPQLVPRPLATESRGHYGSRSVERSLQHPFGFRNPLQSLSPIAARFALESDEKSDPERKTHEFNALSSLVVPPSELWVSYNLHVCWLFVVRYSVLEAKVIRNHYGYPLRQQHSDP